MRGWLPSRKVTPQLGQTTADVEKLNQRNEDEKAHTIEVAVTVRGQLQSEGISIIDKHERRQPAARPYIDENLLVYSYDELDGSFRNMWCQGIVYCGCS